MRAKTKERVPANINLIIKHHDELKHIEKDTQFRTFVIDEAVIAIKDAIKNKSEVAQIFNIVNFKYAISIDKKDFKQTLQNALRFYEHIEDYTKCGKINKIIKKL